MINHRPFQDRSVDFKQMWELLRTDYVQQKDRFTWLFCRLGDWKYGLWQEKKYIPTFFRDHAHLWLDPFDQVLGFVLSESGGGDFVILTIPGYEFLYEEILHWTVTNWLGRSKHLEIEVHEYQNELIQLLTKSGFQSNGMVAETRKYDLSARMPDKKELPQNMRIVSMHEEPDYFQKAVLFMNGFQGKDETTEFDLLRFAYSRENPAYDASMDLSVVTETGQHVATCLGFNDPQNKVAEIEKVCTHHQYRKMGLAERVIEECFYRLKKIGIETAYITGYSAAARGLYEKLGPVSKKDWYLYRLSD